MLIKTMYRTEFSTNKDGYIEITQDTEYGEVSSIWLSPHQMRTLVKYFDSVEKDAETLFSEEQ